MNRITSTYLCGQWKPIDQKSQVKQDTIFGQFPVSTDQEIISEPKKATLTAISTLTSCFYYLFPLRHQWLQYPLPRPER